MKKIEVTQEYLKELLKYDWDTGLFIWTSRRSMFAGKIAGTTDNDGYIKITINSRRFFAHRLAWLYVNGKWPSREIDHINGDPSDNSIENLREATRSQNRANIRYHRNNKTKTKGICYVKYGLTYKWRTSVMANGRRSYSFFDTKEEAQSAYNKEIVTLFGEFACTGARGG